MNADSRPVYVAVVVDSDNVVVMVEFCAIDVELKDVAALDCTAVCVPVLATEFVEVAIEASL